MGCKLSDLLCSTQFDNGYSFFFLVKGDEFWSKGTNIQEGPGECTKKRVCACACVRGCAGVNKDGEITLDFF